LQGKILVAGQEYILDNWSSMGFLAKGYDGDYKNEDRLDVEVSLKSPSGQEFDFMCQAIVVRADKNAKLLAGAFVRIPVETRKKISDHFMYKEGFSAKILQFKDYFVNKILGLQKKSV
jgi:hypothetical protein